MYDITIVYDITIGVCGDAIFSYKGCHISRDAIYCHVFWMIIGFLFVETS